MLRAFVDESYCDDWFFMVAAIVDESQYQEVTSALNDLMADLSYGFDVDPSAEFHGYDLMQGASAWEDVPLHLRLSVVGQALGVIAEHDVKFVVRGIDRDAQRRKYPTAYEPYPLVLTHVMQQANRYAADRGEKVSITCDEIHKDDRHRAMLERHRQKGTPGYTRTKLAAVVNELGFTSSEMSRLVQAADLVAYLKHRMASKPNASRKELRARRGLWQIVEKQIEHDYCWVP